MSLPSAWPIGKRGLPYRQAARVILFDGDGRVLLLKGHDFSLPSRQFWFTPGGGRKPGETLEDTAVRELAEETGIEISPQDLVGPVLHRDALFDFAAIDCEQEEWFFLATIAVSDPSKLSRSGWTALENELVDQADWLTLAQVSAEDSGGCQVYPKGLIDLLRRWQQGWNGETEILVEDDLRPHEVNRGAATS